LELLDAVSNLVAEEGKLKLTEEGNQAFAVYVAPLFRRQLVQWQMAKLSS